MPSALKTSHPKATREVKTELSAKVTKKYGGVKGGFKIKLKAI